ncbi:MAG: hypothetical protein WCG28_01970 [bacterium]
MHGYFWDVSRLREEMAKFAGGQFLMETKVGLVFRGEIRDWVIPDVNKKKILVYFNWLCEPRFGVDKFFTPKPKWILFNPPLGFQFLNVEFTCYYFQRKKLGREERIKMWTPQGEICRFFQKADPSNLKQQGDELLPCYKPSKFDSDPEE